MDSLLQKNKRVVQRFNQEVIAEGNLASFHELMDESFVNHSATPGAANGPGGMWHTFHNILRPALSNLQVHIHAQVAEGEVVTTRKTITGIHTGTLLGVPATEQPVAIEVMDMVRLREGKYYEHWGVNTLAAVLAHLRK
ncbi:ester cyclase [Hymenobacter sp. HMF4947]|uniref:Ester cyclase n=1 Tax=Hymenobacter ginkgonis TaxID=2682976 RepID=A0A7K1TD01_9BACT|nr:ester cyclase [Hymenobacter ginkgonis]MVN76071.1 ester cyclase [Hymenobacter ginkgonis]